jgi:hypothetical protein
MIHATFESVNRLLFANFKSEETLNEFVECNPGLKLKDKFTFKE